MDKILNAFYVYLIYDPRQLCEPFYVGKGRGNRMQKHLDLNKRNRLKFPVYKKIFSLLDSGFQPEFEIREENLYEDEAFILEKQLIRFYGRQDLGTGCLLNLTDGGDGPSGHKHTEETLQKMKGNKNGTGRIDPKRISVVGILGGIVVVRLDFICEAESQGYCSKAIQRCLAGKCTTHAGLIWEKYKTL